MLDSREVYNQGVEILFDSELFRDNPLEVVKNILSVTAQPGLLEKKHMIRMANLPLDAEAINLLYKFARPNDKDFYQAILLNDQLTDFNEYDSALLVNLAQHAGTMFWASHATKINQFKKILESSNCNALVISKILANIQSEDDWYNFDSGIDELIFSKLRSTDAENTPNDIAKGLDKKDLVKLAARAKTLEHFQLILALPKTKSDKEIVAAILNNKAFSLNNWYKPDFWRRRRPNSSIAGMTDEEKLIIIPGIKDTVLLEKIAENIQKEFKKDASGDLSTPESLQAAIQLSETVANNSQLNKRIAKHILNNTEVVKELSTTALNKLAKHATTDEQFKLLLSANNADHSTADAVIQTANKVNFSGWRGVGRTIFSSLPRRMFRGIGNFFNKLLGINKASTGGVRVPNVTVANLIEDVFQKKQDATDGVTKPKFDFSRMSPTSRHVLMKAVTNAETKPDGHDEYLKTLEQAGRTQSVVAKPAAAVDSSASSPTKNPAIIATKSSPSDVKEAAFNSAVTTEKTWQTKFQVTPSIQDKLELRESDKTRCFFKGTTLGAEQAIAFIEAVKLMEEVSTSKPLEIKANNFTSDFIQIIMKELQKMETTSNPVPKVTLWFDNFDELSEELKARVKVYNKLPPPNSDLETQAMAVKIKELEEELKKVSPIIKPLPNGGSSVLTRGINEENLGRDVVDIDIFCNSICRIWANTMIADGEKSIILACSEDTKAQMESIVFIANKLFEIKTNYPDLKMQIEFKNAEGQPINEDNFTKVGMAGQWADFQKKITKIREPSPDADLAPSPLGPGGP